MRGPISRWHAVAKRERGLPSSFDIRVPDRPVEIGDYLDEEANPTQAPERRPEAPVFPPLPQPPVRPYTLTARYQTMRPTSVPRKQVNMTPETLRMVDELLAQVRTYSMEKDVRTSELFHALVLCVYEARANIELGTVQPRGRWGSPTAAALPVALKNAFQDAIVRLRLQKR